MLTDERYKQLMESVGMPNSRSLLQALKQAVMEATLKERERSEWQPIETAPKDQYIDIWICSSINPDYGSRVTNVCKTNKGWIGFDATYLYPKYWMPLPKPPEDKP